MGVVSLPSERSARSQTSPARVSERQTLPLLGLGRVYARRTQKACGTAMRLCASLFRGVAAPLGCVILLPLLVQPDLLGWKDLTKRSGRVTITRNNRTASRLALVWEPLQAVKWEPSRLISRRVTMEEHNLTNEQILAFSTALFQAERSQATVEKYLRNVRAFSLFLDGRPVTKDTVMAWKKHLQREENYSPSTVNASLAALNYLFNFLGWTDCRTHYLKIQRCLFRETGRELDRADYEKLIAAALGLGRERIALVMETICATGTCDQDPQRKER